MKYEEIVNYIKNKIITTNNKEEIEDKFSKLFSKKSIDNLILLFYDILEKGKFNDQEINKIKKSIIDLDPINLKVDPNDIKNNNMDFDDYLYFKNQELKILKSHERAKRNYSNLSKNGKFIFVDPKPENGFNLGFMMYIPNNVEDYTTLMMHCCNTPSGISISSEKEANTYAIDCNINDKSIFDISNQTSLPFFMPIIPRVSGFNTQIHNGYVENGDKTYFDKIQNKVPKKYRISEEEKIKIIKDTRNLDDQIEKMSLYAKDIIRSYGKNVSDKIIVEGFSAGSIFATRFANSKSHLVGSVIIGGNSGKEDIINNDIFKFYYNGSLDNNNPLDKKYDDTFTIEEKEQLEKDYLNNNPNKDINQNIYQIRKQKERLENKPNTVYKIYEGENHKSVSSIAHKDKINFAKKSNLKIIHNELIKKNKNKKSENIKTLKYNQGFISILFISILLLLITLMYIMFKHVFNLLL